MKKNLILIATVFFTDFFFLLVGILLGGAFVVSSRPAPVASSSPSAAVSRPRPRELVCTCVPCLPDLFCMKCGHKSRDCPKLAHYFKKGTNLTDSVTK